MHVYACIAIMVGVHKLLFVCIWMVLIWLVNVYMIEWVYRVGCNYTKQKLKPIKLLNKVKFKPLLSITKKPCAKAMYVATYCDFSCYKN